ncbi:MAG: ribulose-phosphate 3-epimerase [Candidatus Omnitrophica bacterium]|nr:ribulose-phosphate 3-epimerase [Candidatus Omnitrophota bacterium]
MLKCSTSLWSADLANLASEIHRVEPFSERFHLDVADGHYVKNLLFFPDQVKALRPHTRRPFEIHLMVTDPDGWIDPFAEAGADTIIFCHDSARDPAEVLRAIKTRGKQAGISLLVHEPIDLLEPYWPLLDIVTLVGTAMGIKGASMDPSIPGKISRARAIIARRGLKTEIEADGGIRRETVPQLLAAGVDFIVPGSLIFKNDPAQLRAWLAQLGSQSPNL